ncbi:MAG: HAD family hydrolase [Oscillospiraceae bacterium]|jgi:putative hydrolase of the HAD superfamily|nr:HAD family hydrolase [Oscillospiraceae bacterium]MCI9392507.1 HAD family hydrolase [Oscillospiraceae bacterium]
MDKIKGVFFDLGGTLRIVEKVPEHQERAKVRMARLAGREDVEAFINMVEARYEPYREWALGENREAGDYELWHQWLLPELGEERLRAVCHEMTYQYRQVKGLRHVVEGGLQVIRGLYERGYRLGIISNLIGEDEIPNWLREDGLAQYFDAVVLSSVCHIRKPDPAIYRMGCEQLGLGPGECVSVADNLGRDITGAKAAGIGANILFISPEKLAKKTITDENRPDYIVHRFIDILDLPILQ